MRATGFSQSLKVSKHVSLSMLVYRWFYSLFFYRNCVVLSVWLTAVSAELSRAVSHHWLNFLPDVGRNPAPEQWHSCTTQGKVMMALSVKALNWTVEDLDLKHLVSFSVNKFSFWKSLSPKNLSRVHIYVMHFSKNQFFLVYFAVKINWEIKSSGKKDPKDGNKRVSDSKEPFQRRAGHKLRLWDQKEKQSTKMSCEKARKEK